MLMRLYHYLIKAVQEYVEDTCPKKMSVEELSETRQCVEHIKKHLTDGIDQQVADYLISKLDKQLNNYEFITAKSV